MKRSFCLSLLLVLVGSTGCSTTDNNVGSLAHDAGPADGQRQDASGANPASPCATDADCPVGLSCGYSVADGCAAKGVCIPSNCQGGNCLTPAGMCGCDGRGIVAVQIQTSGNSFTVVYASAPSSGRVGPCTGIPDATVPDAVVPDSAAPDSAATDVVSVGKDAAQESISPDAARVCLYPAGADTSVEGGNGSFVGCRPGPTQDLCDPSSYTMTCVASGLTPVSIAQPASALNCKVVPGPTPSNTLFYCCPCAGSPAPDAAVPDAAGVGKDAAQDAPDAGAAYQCQLNTDGTCQAVTPNTACTPFKARRYEESASCIATDWTTLWCCATAAGDSCGWPAATGCLQVSTDAGAVTYWTPAMGLPPSSLPGMQVCDATKSGKVASTSSLCSAPPPDAAVRSDAAAVIMTPTLPAACTTDADCCLAVDGCMATGYLVSKAEYGSMVESIASVNGSGSRVCLKCVSPAVQVQCKGGFCAGEEISTSSSSALLRNSHCGLIAIPDAGAAPAVAAHALVDAGTSGSSPSAWGCGI